MATFGACFGFAATLGPVIGGEFTDKLTWRWCFWINLPLGAFVSETEANSCCAGFTEPMLQSVLSVFFLLPVHPPIGTVPGAPKVSPLKQWLGLDWIGGILSLGMVTTLIMPLQWGGLTKVYPVQYTTSPWLTELYSRGTTSSLLPSSSSYVRFAGWFM